MDGAPDMAVMWEQRLVTRWYAICTEDMKKEFH